MHYKSHQSAIEVNNSFSIKVEDLIREIVIQNDIPYYRIESAVEHNTEEGAENAYMPVIRIITYFEDTVNKISHILHDEFDVDIEKSMNKKKIRIETFAYKNINYTAKLKADRQKQTEYRRSGGKKFEIQICSMLQDAWTGIEKELGYDTTAVPDEAKRDFYRVGALLEMADIEFLKIRTELAQKKLNRQEAAAPQAAQPAPAPQPSVAEQPKIAEQPRITEQPVVAAAPAMAEPAPRVAAPIIAEQPRVVEQPVMAAPQVVAEAPVRAPEPVQAVPEKNPDTFMAHLQAVAREVQKEAVVPQPEPIVFAPPLQEMPRVAAMPAAPVPEPRVAAVVPPPPPPVVQQPVYQAPEPVIPAVAAQAPVQHVAPVAQPAAPQRPAPTAAPVMGIAPKPTVIPAEPVVSSIVSSPNINIDSLKELAQSINHIEPKNVAPVVPPPVKEVYNLIVEEPKPVTFTPPTPVAEVPKAPMPAFEVIPPAVERIVNVPPVAVPEPVAAAFVPPVVPATPVSNMNINGNGIIEKTVTAAEEIAAPVYNEQPKVAKLPVDENAQMTDATLREYVMNSKLLKEVDQQIAERAGAKINSDIDIEGDVERLRFLKVYSLKQLHERITDNKDDIVAFAEKWIGKDNGGSFDSGISLFYLEYLLVGKRNDPAFAVEYVVKFISDNDYSARYIIPTYNSIHNTEAPNFSHLTLKA